MKNNGQETIFLEPESRVAQGIFVEYKTVDGDNTCNGDISSKDNREGGFGSTNN